MFDAASDSVQPTTADFPRAARIRAVALWAGRPMISGIGRLAAFSAFVLLSAVLLHAMIDAGLRRIDTSSFGVWNRIVDGRINADVVISGSSRALSHYDPRIIAKYVGLRAYNIGLNGSQTDMQTARFATYLRYNKAPLLLIHNLDAFSFQTTHGGVYDPGQYMPYLREPAIYDALLQIDHDAWKSKYVPLYGYAVQDLRFSWIAGIAGVLGWTPTEDHFLGFEPRHRSWTDDFARLKASNPNGVTFEIEPEGVAAMESLLRLCNAHGVKVILVYSPEYEEMQRLTLNRREIFKAFEKLGRDFSADLWDYSNSPLSAHKRYFYNSQHLNAEGAELFSRELASRIASDSFTGLLAEAASRNRAERTQAQ